ncbi:MAG: hypothetical protein AAGA30_18270, partial [Planctomycetota bacterium]
MSNSPTSTLADLLVQKSIVGLTPQEQEQLKHLQCEHGVDDNQLANEIERIELSAAAADLAYF